jgi:hypothetical protein
VCLIKINPHARTRDKWLWGIGFFLLPFLATVIYRVSLQEIGRMWLRSHPNAASDLTIYGLFFVCSLPILLILIQWQALRMFRRKFNGFRPSANPNAV